MIDETIKSNLLKKRTELGLTQTEMARRLEMSLTAYRKLEIGTTRILNEHFERFAQTTDSSIAELVIGFEPGNRNLEAIQEDYESRIRQIELEHRKEVEDLEETIKALKDKIKDKEDLIETDRKLISHYEKALEIKDSNL